MGIDDVRTGFEILEWSRFDIPAGFETTRPFTAEFPLTVPEKVLDPNTQLEKPPLDRDDRIAGDGKTSYCLSFEDGR